MIEYFHEVHKLTLEPDQPLLYVKLRGEKIYLPTQYSYEASLSDEIVKDTQAMRDID